MKTLDRALSVGELNEYVRRMLAADGLLQHISLQGEISNFKRHSSGHWYFSLKDELSRINCVMFRQNNLAVRIMPQDGMQVVLTGSVSLFVRDGVYQFYAEGMRQDGLGDLYLRFEQLKARLQKEGLFDAAHKRPLPLLPQKVGIVTSRTGAVLHDICQVAWRRFPGIPLALFPVAVQGEGAANEIAQGIQVLGSMPGMSVIIVGRGGGSMEDLWAFNEEIVARAIYNCPVPVVSAVGHETDFTIADFVADMRAPTPSAAAEVTVPVKTDLLETLRQMQTAMESAAEKCLLTHRGNMLLLKNRLQACHPQALLHHVSERKSFYKGTMDLLMQSYLQQKKRAVDTLGATLAALGPQKVLNRGYAIAMQAGVPVASVGNVEINHPIQVILADGQVHAQVLHTERGLPFDRTKARDV